MDSNKIIHDALEVGFSGAEIIDTENIEFSFQFRKYCEENVCGKYGENYSCPPDCGTPQEMHNRVMAYKKALVLQSSWKIDDLNQKEKLENAKAWHNSAMLRLINKLKSDGYCGLMAGASGCNLCDVCQKTKGAPCKHPEAAFSCLSAYCINVMALAGQCSMNYTYKDGILSFFGVYFFNKVEK